MTTGTRLERNDNYRPDAYEGGAAITTSDTNELAVYANAIYVGGAGNINLVTLDGSTILLTAVPVGTILRIATKQVKATNTTATLLIGLY